MAINFPSDTSNSPFTDPDTGYVFEWDGEKWVGSVPPVGGYVLPVATDSVLGGVKVGARLTIDGSGILSADVQGGGGASVQVGETYTGSPQEGDLWWDSSDDSGRLYVWYEDGNTNQWVDASPAGSGGGGVEEAPIDTKQYARQDGAWAEVEGGGGGGIPEAPTDGQQYARQNEAWSVVQAGDNTTTINYSGAAAWGNVGSDTAINAGFNVESVTLTAPGQFRVNFTNPMPNADYAVVGSRNGDGGTGTKFGVMGQDANGFNCVLWINGSGSTETTGFSFAVHALNAMPPQGGTGTDAWGAITNTGVISGGFNISSVDRPSTGNYTINFINDMPSANYSVVASPVTGVNADRILIGAKRTDGFDITYYNTADTAVNAAFNFTVNATNAVLPNTITEDQIAALIQNPTVSSWGYFEPADLTAQNTFNATVTSVAVGQFQVTFDTPMPNADYAVATSMELSGANATSVYNTVLDRTAEGFVVRFIADAGFKNPTGASFVVTSSARNGTLGGGADAWASVNSDASDFKGLNIASVGRSGTKYVVTFTNPMPNTDYAVIGSGDISSNNFYFEVNSANKTVNGFEYWMVGPDNAAGTGNSAAYFAVFATDGNAGGFWVREGQGASEVLKPLNNDATIEASALTDGTTTKTMTEVLAGGSGGGGIPEAPTDGQQYARQNSNWSVVQAGDNNTTINYQGAAAWGQVNAAGDLRGKLNCTVSTTIKPDGSVVAAATGVRYVTFDTPMPNNEYAVTTSNAGLAGGGNWDVNVADKLAEGFTVWVRAGAGTPADQGFDFAVHALNALPPQGGTGTDAWGSIAQNGDLEGTFNVADVVLNSAGNYTVSFTNPMPNANYSVVATPRTGGTRYIGVNNKTVNGFDVVTYNDSNTSTSSPFSFSVNATNAVLPNTITEDQIAALIQNPVLSAWAAVAANGNLLGNFNIASITKVVAAGDGVYDVFFDQDMPNTNYSVVATSTVFNTLVINKNVGDFRVQTFDNNGNGVDAAFSCQISSTARNGTLGGGADAWVRSSANGTIQGSFNISNVNRTAEGRYTVTFANPMPSADYAAVAISGNLATSVTSQTANGFDVRLRSNSTLIDNDGQFSVAVFATDGNAGGFWVKTGDELAPLSATNNVSIGGGDIQLNADGTAEFAGNIDAAGLTDGTTTRTMTDVLATRIHAWGTINKDATISGSKNVSGVSKVQTGVYQITFADPISYTNYAVTTSLEISALSDLDVDFGRTAFVYDKQTSGFKVAVCSTASSNKIDLSFSFSVLA